MLSAIINNKILFEMTNREKAKKLFEESLKKHDTHIYIVKPIHCTAAIDAIEQALSISNVVKPKGTFYCKKGTCTEEEQCNHCWNEEHPFNQVMQ